MGSRPLDKESLGRRRPQLPGQRLADLDHLLGGTRHDVVAPQGFLLVVAAGTSRRATELGVAGSAQCGRTVWIAVRIAVVWMQLDHAMVGVDARLMTNCVCQCERTAERER